MTPTEELADFLPFLALILIPAAALLWHADRMLAAAPQAIYRAADWLGFIPEEN